MNILPPEDIKGALSWLTTGAFEALDLPVLAVVLCDGHHPEHRALLEHLQEECRHIDRTSRQILILSMGTEAQAPGIFNPLWRLNPSSECAHWFQDARGRIRGHKMGTHWGGFSESAIRLLDLEPACLPAVYIRFKPATGDCHHCQPIVVPLRHQKMEQASRFLTQLSCAADDHIDGGTAIDLFLERSGLAGWRIREATQDALDRTFDIIEARRHILMPDGPDPEELARVQLAYDISVKREGWMSCGDHDDFVRKLEQFFCCAKGVPDTAFHRPDLVVALRLASVAHAHGDYGTVVRNIGAAVEAFFAASVLHLVRGARNIRLPSYLDHYDPGARRVIMAGIEINKPRHEVRGSQYGCKTPWEAPSLAQGVQVLECFLGSDHMPQAAPVDALDRIARFHADLAKLRNPPAHGVMVSREQAESAWCLLADAMCSGQIAAMAAIRRGFDCWPSIDWRVLSRIQANPHRHYDQARRDVEAADEKCRRLRQEWDLLCAAQEKRQAALDCLTAIIQAGTPHLKKLLNQPALGMVKDELNGWAQLEADLKACSVCDRQAKRLAGSACRWFSTPSRDDRHRLAEISRILTPSPDTVRNMADIDRVISGLEAVLAGGIVTAKPGNNWQTEVRASLERWAHALSRHAEIAARMTPTSVGQIAIAWKATIEVLVRQGQSCLKEAEIRKEQAEKYAGCAKKRLEAAGTGQVLACECGRHGTPVDQVPIV